jgi:hypothetical protein
MHIFALHKDEHNTREYTTELYHRYTEKYANWLVKPYHAPS